MKSFIVKNYKKIVLIAIFLLSISFNFINLQIFDRYVSHIERVAVGWWSEPIASQSLRLDVYTNYYDLEMERIFPVNSSFDDRVISHEQVRHYFSDAQYGGMVQIRDDVLFVDGSGKSWILSQGALRAGPAFDIPNNVGAFSDFIDNDFLLRYFGIKDVYVYQISGASFASIYVSSVDFDPDEECYFLSVFEAKISSNNYEILDQNWERIFASRPCLELHNGADFYGQSAGGRLVGDGFGAVYVSIGDFYFDGVNERNIVNVDGSNYGSIVRVDNSDQHYTIATGLRNPQGLFYNSEIIYETEHGPQGGDELNVVGSLERGTNFGWPNATFGVDYGTFEWPLDISNQNHFYQNFVRPIFSWTPSIGVSDIILVDGSDSFSRWEGNLLVSGMRDQSLYRLVLDGFDKIIAMERIEIGFRVRDLLQVDDQFYLLEDAPSPAIWRLSIK